MAYIISVYAIFDDQRFNDTLTNDIFSFEQLGPDCKSRDHKFKSQLGCRSFMEIHHIYFCGHCPTSADSRRAFVSYWRNYVHKY